MSAHKAPRTRAPSRVRARWGWTTRSARSKPGKRADLIAINTPMRLNMAVVVTDPAPSGARKRLGPENVSTTVVVDGRIPQSGGRQARDGEYAEGNRRRRRALPLGRRARTGTQVGAKVPFAPDLKPALPP